MTNNADGRPRTRPNKGSMTPQDHDKGCRLEADDGHNGRAAKIVGMHVDGIPQFAWTACFAKTAKNNLLSIFDRIATALRRHAHPAFAYTCHYCGKPTSMPAYVNPLDETFYYPSCCVFCAQTRSWVPEPLDPRITSSIAEDPRGRKLSEDALHRHGRRAPWEGTS